MIPQPASAIPSTPATAPALAAGLALVGVALAALSPVGTALASAFTEGWLAVYMDAQVFRLYCF